MRINKPIGFDKFKELVEIPKYKRKGPVFIEIPLDVQGYPIEDIKYNKKNNFLKPNKTISLNTMKKKTNKILEILNNSKRPTILIGAGVTRETCNKIKKELRGLKIPIMLTWNASDRIGSEFSNYFGRPNTWGQRYSNIIIQQSDTLLAIGTLSLIHI